ncbi:hypothetical protein [Candidatus Pelagibacter sp. HIMB1506]|uniref:hypothetical protein n=1 Tax=Candidatus Pelagibacter sp. HIMB1506 TaxID=3413337 RepID=UPI003F85C0EA
MPKPKKKIKSFNTSELKKNILGDWISILNFPLIIFFYYLWFNQDKVTDDTSDFIYVALILPAALGLFCVFKYSKEYKFSKFGPSFWIILFGFIWWTFLGDSYNHMKNLGKAHLTLFGETILHDVIFYGSLLTGFIINLSKIKNFFRAISYTFGQIPFIFIALFFVKAGLNAIKK